MICKHFVENIFKRAWALFLHTVKLAPVFIHKNNNLTSVINFHTFKWIYTEKNLLIISFLNELELILHPINVTDSTPLNSFNYCYLILIILFNVTDFLYTVEWFHDIYYITDDSIKQQSFVYTQLND